MPPATTCVVSALVQRDERLLLVEQRGPWDPTPNWMLPGGRVEAGETLVEALHRELAEETGLRLIGEPTIAFVVEIASPEGTYLAITFDSEAEGTVMPRDPDGIVQGAAWIGRSDALERLACVAWYDCAPLSRFLTGEAPPGTVYAFERQ